MTININMKMYALEIQFETKLLFSIKLYFEILIGEAYFKLIHILLVLLMKLKKLQVCTCIIICTRKIS